MAVVMQIAQVIPTPVTAPLTLHTGGVDGNTGKTLIFKCNILNIS